MSVDASHSIPNIYLEIFSWHDCTYWYPFLMSMSVIIALNLYARPVFLSTTYVHRVTLCLPGIAKVLYTVGDTFIGQWPEFITAPIPGVPQNLFQWAFCRNLSSLCLVLVRQPLPAKQYNKGSNYSSQSNWLNSRWDARVVWSLNDNERSAIDCISIVGVIPSYICLTLTLSKGVCHWWDNFLDFHFQLPALETATDWEYSASHSYSQQLSSVWQ